MTFKVVATLGLLLGSAPAFASTTPPPPATRMVEPNENLIATGIPPIPAELAERVGRYTEMRTASFSSWHPTEPRMLISTRFGNTNQVHELRSPLGARQQRTFFPERVVAASYPPVGDPDFFVFSQDRGGSEFFQLYRFDLSTGRELLLSDGGRSQNGLGPWSPDGVWMAYASTRRNGRDRDIWVIDPRRPESNRIVVELEGGGWSAVGWSPDGRELTLVEYLSVNESAIWVVDVASGVKRLVTPKVGIEPVSWSSAQFSADGKSLWVISDRDAEFRRLGRLSLVDGTFEAVSGDLEWDVAGFDLSRDQRWLAFSVNESGFSRSFLVDTTTGTRQPLPSPGVGVVTLGTWHPNGRWLAFGFSNSASPGDVWAFDRERGTIERWTESETGGVPTADLPESELIRWRSFDDLEITGFLSRPPARFTGKRPVIISIHGGPEGQSRPSFLGANAFWVNELGIAWLAPNVRGSTGFGKTFVKLDNGAKREDSVRDVSALLDWIATQPDLDPERVMITGGSYGGYMTMALAIRENARIRCSVQVVGIANFVSFLERTESYRRDLRRVEYGDEREPAMRELLTKISPLTRASEIRKPFFAVQGANDPRVPLFEAEQIIAAVAGNGIPVWSLIAKDEGHGFAKKANRDFQFYATVAFVERFLLGDG